MRDHQVGCADYEIPVQQDIDVDGSRSLGDHAPTAQFLFDLNDTTQQLLRKKRRLHLRHEVQEIALRGKVHRLGFIYGRQPPHGHLARVEFVNGSLQHGFAIAYVRAEPEIDGLHARMPTRRSRCS